MNAKDFYERFISIVKEDTIHKDHRNYRDIYKEDAPAYTTLINKTIIPQIIKEAGLFDQNEYLRIDTIGWSKKTLTEKDDSLIEARRKQLGLSRHLWDLKIAVEHENNRSDWTDELIKLAHIRCPLKVIIGYAPCDERTDIEEEKLSFAYDCLLGTAAFDPNANEEFLIILGNGAPRHKSNRTYDKFDYRGYVLSKGSSRFDKLDTAK